MTAVPGAATASGAVLAPGTSGPGGAEVLCGLCDRLVFFALLSDVATSSDATTSISREREIRVAFPPAAGAPHRRRSRASGDRYPLATVGMCWRRFPPADGDRCVLATVGMCGRSDFGAASVRRRPPAARIGVVPAVPAPSVRPLPVRPPPGGPAGVAQASDRRRAPVRLRRRRSSALDRRDSTHDRCLGIRTGSLRPDLTYLCIPRPRSAWLTAPRAHRRSPDGYANWCARGCHRPSQGP
jgi:hypothetical protein